MEGYNVPHPLKSSEKQRRIFAFPSKLRHCKLRSGSLSLWMRNPHILSDDSLQKIMSITYCIIIFWVLLLSKICTSRQLQNPSNLLDWVHTCHQDPQVTFRCAETLPPTPEKERDYSKFHFVRQKISVINISKFQARLKHRESSQFKWECYIKVK